ncbi:family 1 glycosylhydrolase [Brevundimonas sp.]|uniref:family 1 glycosylhydrolase n=1 Tax=Brevundimonas sp. TaxID=1871086 RepID=UPI0039190F6D
MNALELWGGHECTVNRVGDVWRDQTVLSGHQDRLDDLDLFADLGLKAIRFPVLWERTETAPGRFDWGWADQRLQRLKDLGLRPVLGLLHHGAGPSWTNLLDPAFAEGLARFAAAVATRYPWVDDWTPVNEPLTTARFSALYGHWHPHARDEGAFWLALINQVDATRLAMEAIRAVNPAARLIQTEDFGHTWSTPPCEGQARHENERRLATWDLLIGRVVPGHPLWPDLERSGLADRAKAIADAPCPPDVLGLNHYVTSDRLLDHRLHRYPAGTRGGNGRIAYADVEAVRVVDDYPCGWARSLETLWKRYELPIAITECHLGCDTDSQRRWLSMCWEAASRARSRGVDVRAVTVWALLGSHDWDSLVTEPKNHYEAGAFDVSSGAPRPTALADLVRTLADGDPAPRHRSSGWWEEPRRILYPPFPKPRAMSEVQL